jgi:hypothetical protein
MNRKLLAILLVVLVILRYAHSAEVYKWKRVYAFKKGVTVNICWDPIPEKKISYWIFVHTYSNSIPWSTVGTANTIYPASSATILGDSALVYIAAEDSVGNRGMGSDTIKIAFRPDGIIPPPIEPPPSGSYDIPLTENLLRNDLNIKWKKHGSVGRYARTFDGGLGFYFFEDQGAGEFYNCWVTKDFNLPKNQVKFTMIAVTRDTLNSINVSVGQQVVNLKLPKKKNYGDTLGYEMSANFSIPAAGIYTLKVDPLHSICWKSYNFSVAGVPLDTTPPGKVHLADPAVVEQK